MEENNEKITPENEKASAEAQTAEAEIEVVEAEAEKNYELMYNEMLDKYQRSLAEFDNFRKRTTKEMTARYEDGKKAAAAKFLPCLDNLERAVFANENKDDNFYQGIVLILRGFETAFGDMDIKPIELEPGAHFNANFHNAVAHTEDENFGENQVAEVLQKGYMFKDKVLRHAMVKVAN